MAYDHNPVVLDPTRPAGWCDTCDGLRHFAPPTPPIQPRPTVAGVVTIREGQCRECGNVLSRVGGGRDA